ncbi:MAG: subtilisin-like proprotein convertase family protein, partial [Cognaticolwellia sp.]
AYLDENGTPKVFATILGADADAIVSTVVQVSSEPGLDFSNSSAISDTLSVGSCPEIASAQVQVDISHTYQGDVSMVVTSPDGTGVTLWSGAGGSTDDIAGLFDANSGTDYINGSSSNFTISSLNNFIGEDGGGTWQLDLSDAYSGDDGTLNAWTVYLSCPL